MSEATTTHVESSAEVLAAKSECAAIDARRSELQAEAERLQGLLRTVKAGTTIQEDPASSFERIMQREDLASLAMQKADVSARYAEVMRDLRALEQFRHKASNRVQSVRGQLTKRRARGTDFIAALREVSEAATRLEKANHAMRVLVSEVMSREGHSNLLNAQFAALVIGLQDVASWRAAAEAICGVSLSLEEPQHD